LRDPVPVPRCARCLSTSHARRATLSRHPRAFSDPAPPRVRATWSGFRRPLHGAAPEGRGTARARTARSSCTRTGPLFREGGRASVCGTRRRSTTSATATMHGLSPRLSCPRRGTGRAGRAPRDEERDRVPGPSEGRAPGAEGHVHAARAGCVRVGVRRRRSLPRRPGDTRCRRRIDDAGEEPAAHAMGRPRPPFRRRSAKSAVVREARVPSAVTAPSAPGVSPRPNDDEPPVRAAHTLSTVWGQVLGWALRACSRRRGSRERAERREQDFGVRALLETFVESAPFDAANAPGMTSRARPEGWPERPWARSECLAGSSPTGEP
jgi:hypothetical protein